MAGSDTPDAADHEIAVFVEEANELIALMEDRLVRLEREPASDALLQDLFRAAHTLKSSWAMLGFRGMSDVTHAMEDFFEGVRGGALHVGEGAIDVLLESLDSIKATAVRLAAGDATEPDVAAQLARLRHLSGAESPAGGEADAGLEELVQASPQARAQIEAAESAGRGVHVVDVSLNDDSERNGVRCYQVLGVLERLADVVLSLPSIAALDAGASPAHVMALVVTDEPTRARAAVADVAGVGSTDVRPWSPRLSQGTPTASVGESLGRSMRVDLERLDQLMNTAGELVVDRTRMSELTRILRSRYGRDEVVRDLCDTSAHLFRIVDELSDSMTKVRMVPIADLFASLPRLARDLARTTGKSVDLQIEGEKTELDRSIIDQIRDPLVHVLRNAIDHGIELPEERRAAGKPVPGVVRIAARHEEGRVVVSVRDDGRGIDPALVRARAVERGVATHEDAERLTDAAALEMVFEAGLSTSTRVTETSGRGVGMDIVRRNVAAVNGLVELESAAGAGTSVTLRLPLTLATFRALLVEVGATIYAIPLGYVRETAKLDDELVATVRGAPVLTLRGETMPLISLRQVHDGGAAPARNDDASLVVVQAGERRLALTVDALVDQREIVAKPLPVVKQFAGVVGASILGDGRVALILDTAALAATAGRKLVAAA